MSLALYNCGQFDQDRSFGAARAAPLFLCCVLPLSDRAIEPTARTTKGRMRIRARQIPVAAEGDIASCHRLNDVNESFQRPADEMVVHHPLIPLSDLDKQLPNDTGTSRANVVAMMQSAKSR